MELLQLRYFCDAAGTENFSKTAKKFSVPPSDISQSIRRLEKELGVDLFSRKANRIFLNKNGSIFLEKASAALSLLEEGVNAVSEKEDRGEIRLCINTNRRLVMQAVERFRPLYPAVDIKTKLMSDAKGEEFDLIISDREDALPHYREEKLLTERIAIAVCADSPFSKSTTTLKELQNEPFITGGENSTLFRVTTSLCEREGFSPRIAMQSDDPYYIRKCVELGLGVALIPTFSWKGQIAESITLIPIKDAYRTTYLYYPDRNPPPRLKRFLDILREECKKERP